MSINSVSISGNLTRDCELRTTQNGTQILTFTVAVNDRKKDQNGKWVDVPNYIDCCIFGNRAESVSRFISKGSKVSCHGKLRWSQWNDKNGQKRSKVEIVVDEIEFMSRRDSQGQNQPQNQQTDNYTNQPQNAPYSGSQQPAGYPPQGYQQPYQPQQGYPQQPQAPTADAYASEDIPFRKAVAR